MLDKSIPADIFLTPERFGLTQAEASTVLEDAKTLFAGGPPVVYLLSVVKEDEYVAPLLIETDEGAEIPVFTTPDVALHYTRTQVPAGLLKDDEAVQVAPLGADGLMRAVSKMPEITHIRTFGSGGYSTLSDRDGRPVSRRKEIGGRGIANG